jgi:uncharacterized protein
VRRRRRPHLGTPAHAGVEAQHGPRSELRIGQRDVYLGEIAGTSFYIGSQQFEHWQHTQLLIDVVPGRGGGFSLEAPLGVRFLTRSRVFDAAEQGWLDAWPPPRGPQQEGAR